MRDQLLAALRVRIESAARTQDAADVRTEQALADAEALLPHLVNADAEVDLEIAHLLGLFHGARASLPGNDGTTDTRWALTLLYVVHLDQPDAVPEPMRSSWAAVETEAAKQHAVLGALSDVAMLLAERVALGDRRVASAAIRLLDDVAEHLAPDDPRRPVVLCNLGYALMVGDTLARPAKDCDRAAVESLVDLFGAALATTPPDHPNYARCAYGSAIAVRAAAILDDDQSALVASIGLFRTAVDSATEADEFVPQLLQDLAETLLLTQNAGHPTDPEQRHQDLLDTVKVPMLAAVDGTDWHDPITATWRLLGVDATDTDSRFGQIMDVFRTLAHYPNDVGWGEVLAKVSAYQERQFEHLGPADRRAAMQRLLTNQPAARRKADLAGLAEVSGLVEQLRRELPDDHPERAGVDTVHVLLVLTRAFHLDTEDPREAMAAMAAAMTMAMDSAPKFPDGSTVTGERLTAAVSLGHALLSPAEILSVTERAVRDYRARLATGAPADQLTDRKHLAHALFFWFDQTGQKWAFQEAVDLARQIVAVTTPPDPGIVTAWTSAVTRSINLSDDDPTDRATEAIDHRDGPGALEALEDTRATTLSVAFNTRRELDNLRAADPELATRFIAIRERAFADLNPGREARPADARPSRTDSEREWAEVHDRIIALPGFDRFLLPVTLGPNDLRPAAADGPVIMVNIDDRRCDAITLTAQRIDVVALPDLTAADLAARAAAFRTAIEHAPTAQPVLLDTLSWLWDVLAEPVLNALGYTDSPPPGQPWPRVWWSPAGPLNFLPVHAAGHYQGDPGASTLDRVVSSYTPTLRALIYSRARPQPARHTVLSVAMPATPGHLPLPATADEAAAFAADLTGPGRLVGPAATRAGVFSALPEATIAHFACHANSDPLTVSDSHLVLHDGPLTIAEIGRLRLDTAELAYLSACATARGNTAFANEALHIASAFQLAGYAQAVGTLWPVSDRVAARVARHFYRELTDATHAVDRLPAAVALHQVTRRLRATAPTQPWLWAGYVHSGA
jgi:CHAT domain